MTLMKFNFKYDQKKVNEAIKKIESNWGQVALSIWRFEISWISWSMYKADDKIVIEIISKPWYVSSSMIEEKLNQFFN